MNTPYKGPAVVTAKYQYCLAVDRQRFLTAFDQNNTQLFSVPALLNYDPVVHNPGNTDYLLFCFEGKPTLREQTLIQLALSEILYTGPAVADAHKHK